jgi:uncharacterized membrane protein YesL
VQVILRALIDWWDAWLSLAIINSVWALCCLSVVLGPPATFGMYYCANELVHGRGVGLSDLVAGGRRYFVKSWVWGLYNVAIATLAYVSIQFYGRVNADWGPILQAAVGVLVAFWLITQFYALPYFMEQSEKRLLLAMRNGLFTALASPVYTLIVVGFAAIIAVISVALVALLFLGGPAYITILGHRAVLERIETFGVRERDAGRGEEKS